MKNQEILRLAKEIFSKNANEFETRKKLIDVILESVLGWGFQDISYEERVSEDGNTTFADYIIRTADVAILVEAKRVSANFVFNSSKRKVKLNGSIMQGDIGDAIVQARDYCRKKSIPFAVVTNGLQWVIFPGCRTDDVPFNESSAIVFDDLNKTLGEEIQYFMSLLSRDSVIEGNLSVELLGRKEDQIEERRLNRFTRGSNTRPSNPIFPLIENEIVTAFSETIAEADPSMLEKCYVKSADRQKFDERIHMHLQKREPLFSSSPKRPMRKKDETALTDALKSAVDKKRPLAILILGTVGTGKTTFIQYTRRVSASAFFEKSADKPYPHWINVDFRDFSKNEVPIEYIYSALFDYLIHDDFFKHYDKGIKAAYREEIEALKIGPLGMLSDEQEFNKEIASLIKGDYIKKIPYVDKLVKYATSRTPVYLVIDNVDQFEDEAVEANIFSDAIAIARRFNLNLIIAMRESTYVNHRNSPTFDAFDFDPVHIEPPEISSVLSKRFFLAKQLLEGKSGSFTALNGAEFDVKDLSIFIDLLKSSVLGSEIGDRIDVLANQDVRLALRMTREFLARGYTDPAKALNFYQSKGQYQLPKQEAFRSILLGNQSVYSEKYSVIGNPFDSRLGRSNGELLRMFVLAALVKQGSISGPNYIDFPTIRENLNKIGFSEDDSMDVLKDLYRLRFAQTRSHRQPDSQSTFFATRLGGHLIKELIGDFTFVENVLMDTFISDKVSWDKLRSLTDDILNEKNVVSRIKLRTQRVRIFYDYVTMLYLPILNEATQRGLDAIWLTNPLVEQRSRLESNLNKALASAKRIYG